MGFHNTPGERTIDRLAARNELYRVNVPNGGEAISGPLAGRALQALGGEAMTVDKTIIVNESFDTSNPEDLALYAHEQYHVEKGTGEGGAHHIHEAEEVAARAVQRMVLHRMTGGYEGGYQPGGGGGPGGNDDAPDQGGRGRSDYNESAENRPDATDDRPDAAKGYLAMKAQGMTHQDIVDKISRDVIAVLDAKRGAGSDRHNDKKGSF